MRIRIGSVAMVAVVSLVCALPALGCQAATDVSGDWVLTWNFGGESRDVDLLLDQTEDGLKGAIEKIRALREEFWRDVRVLGANEELNQSLEKAGRVADYFELAELMCFDALEREESCGGHFRLEHQTEDGEALRDDENYANVSAWEWVNSNTPQKLQKEPLEFEYVPPSQRSYK